MNNQVADINKVSITMQTDGELVDISENINHPAVSNEVVDVSSDFAMQSCAEPAYVTQNIDHPVVINQVADDNEISMQTDGVLVDMPENINHPAVSNKVVDVSSDLAMQSCAEPAYVTQNIDHPVVINQVADDNEILMAMQPHRELVDIPENINNPAASNKVVDVNNDVPVAVQSSEDPAYVTQNIDHLVLNNKVAIVSDLPMQSNREAADISKVIDPPVAINQVEDVINDMTVIMQSQRECPEVSNSIECPVLSKQVADADSTLIMQLCSDPADIPRSVTFSSLSNQMAFVKNDIKMQPIRESADIPQNIDHQVAVISNDKLLNVQPCGETAAVSKSIDQPVVSMQVTDIGNNLTVQLCRESADISKSIDEDITMEPSKETNQEEFSCSVVSKKVTDFGNEIAMQSRLESADVPKIINNPLMSTEATSVTNDRWFYNGFHAKISTCFPKSKLEEDQAAYNRVHDVKVDDIGQMVPSMSILMVGDARVSLFVGLYDSWKKIGCRRIFRLRSIYQGNADYTDLSCMLEGIDLDHYGTVLFDLLHSSLITVDDNNLCHPRGISEVDMKDLTNIWKLILSNLYKQHPNTEFMLIIPPIADFREANSKLDLGIENSRVYAKDLKNFRDIWYSSTLNNYTLDANMVYGTAKQRKDLLCFLQLPNLGNQTDTKDNLLFPFNKYSDKGFSYNCYGRNRILHELASKLNRLSATKNIGLCGDSSQLIFGFTPLESQFPKEKKTFDSQSNHEKCHLLHSIGHNSGDGSDYDTSTNRDNELPKTEMYNVGMMEELVSYSKISRSSRKRKKRRLELYELSITGASSLSSLCDGSQSKIRNDIYVSKIFEGEKLFSKVESEEGLVYFKPWMNFQEELHTSCFDVPIIEFLHKKTVVCDTEAFFSKNKEALHNPTLDSSSLKYGKIEAVGDGRVRIYSFQERTDDALTIHFESLLLTMGCTSLLPTFVFLKVNRKGMDVCEVIIEVDELNARAVNFLFYASGLTGTSFKGTIFQSNKAVVGGGFKVEEKKMIAFPSVVKGIEDGGIYEAPCHRGVISGESFRSKDRMSVFAIRKTDSSSKAERKFARAVAMETVDRIKSSDIVRACGFIIKLC